MNAPHNSAQARAWRPRTAAVLAAVGALGFSSGIVMLTAPAANAANITICHANNSPTQPYNLASVDDSSTDESQAHYADADPATTTFRWGSQGAWWNGQWYPPNSPRVDLIPGTNLPASTQLTDAFCNAAASVGPRAVTPSVTWHDPSCLNGNTASWEGTAIEGVSYTPSGDVEALGEVTVTATLAPGYELARGATDTFDYEFGPLVPCGTLTPQDPMVVQPACTGPGTSSALSVVLATGPAGVSYAYDAGVVTATVTDDSKAFADDLGEDWVRVDDHTATYAVDVDEVGDCLDPATAAVPSGSDNTCTLPGHLVLPSTPGDGYSWEGETQDAPGDHAVTAVADAGYYMQGQVQWTVHVKAAGEGLTNCSTDDGGPVVTDPDPDPDPENPGNPNNPGNPDPGTPPVPTTPNPELIPVTPNYASATDATCSRRGALIVPNQPQGVLVTRSGSVPGTVTFTYAPASGYTFPAGTVTTSKVKVDAKKSGDECLLGDEEVEPTHTSKPTHHVKPKPRDRGPVVLGTQAAVPTAVDAGLASLPTAVVSSTGSPRLAQALVAGGLLMLVAGGSMGLGRRTRGAHES